MGILEDTDITFINPGTNIYNAKRGGIELSKENPRNEISLSFRMIILIIFLTTIGSLIALGLFGLYTTGPSSSREGWRGGESKRGAPGESVYFNYTVEVNGGRHDYIAKIKNFQCQWESDVNPGKITVHPDESRNLSIRIHIPEDAEIDTRITIYLDIHSYTCLHGFKGGASTNSETLYLTVDDEGGDSNNDVNDNWASSQWFLGGGFDIVYFIMSLYIVLFAQALIFFMIPAIRKFKKRSDMEGGNNNG